MFADRTVNFKNYFENEITFTPFHNHIFILTGTPKVAGN